MKKTRSMRVALGMLALTLITSCFVGGTFAKYVRGTETKDSARVAKFGVTIAADGDAFSKAYIKDDATYMEGDDGAFTVRSDVKVVAPGTKGELGAVKLEGTPEVAVRVAYSDVKFELKNWEIPNGENKVEYCPIIITVGDTDYKVTDDANIAAFETAVKDAIAAYSVDYPPLTDFSTIGEDGGAAALPAISWRWEFEGNGATLNGYQTDAKDTDLGDQAAADATNAGTISFEMTVTVTQID